MRKFVLGAVIVIAGLLLLAFNFDLLEGDLKHIIFSWQMLLIVIGIVSLIGREGRGPGLILIVIGCFFLIPKIFGYNIEFVKVFWPVLLIIIGVLILFRKGGYGGHYHDKFRRRFEMRTGESNVEDGYIREENIFSGSKHKVIAQEFKGGRISNIFGGTEIDLTQATLAEGRNELIIECVFGGITLIVPSNWKVVLQVSSILGGFQDKRSIVKPDPDSTRILVIKGSAIFGGGEIKSY
ncbi:MAG: LiaF-related protein [Bacteroidetes bacterium]|nr:LiaF-related protein [Bacteroidota bacterium]